MKHRGHLLTWTRTTVAVDGQPVAAEVAVVPGDGHANEQRHTGPAIKMRGGQAWGGDVIVRFDDGSYLTLCPWRQKETAKALAPAAELHQLLGAQALGAPVAASAPRAPGVVPQPETGKDEATKPGGA